MTDRPRRRRHPTELRLDKMSKLSEDLADGEEALAPCPKCQGKLTASRLEVEGGSCRLLRCEDCGYVYMKRT